MLVTVPGLQCRHDVRAIGAALADVEGVVALRADPAARTVRIEGDVSPAAVREAIVAAGYSVS